LNSMNDVTPRTDMEMEWLIHELQVHQIELEMQNEEIEHIRSKLDVGLERFSKSSESYDSAPIGFVSIDRDGIIRKINRIAADLFGVERFRLINRPFDLFIPAEVRSTFKAFQERIFSGTAKEAFELTLLGNRDASVAVTVNATVSEDGKEWLAVLTGITEPKKMAETLRESETNYRALFENAVVAITQVDARGNFLRVNSTFEELIGYTREELKSMNVREIMHPDYLEQTREIVAKQINGEINHFSLEQYYVRKDGSLRWGEMRSTSIRDDQGRLLSAVVAIIDRTKRKQAEEALAKNEALYRNLFENASIGMFQSTLDPGRFLRVNSAYAKMLGYESPEDLMSTVTDIGMLHVDPEDRNALLAAMEQQDWFYGEYPRFRKDGSTMIGKVAIRRVLKPDGTIDYLEGIVEDVTKRKQAEEERKKYFEEIADLYENAPCGYHSLGKDGMVIRMNDTELSWLGYSREEVIGKVKYADLLAPEGVKAFQHGFALMKEKGTVLDMESTLLRKDGTSFPILLNATAIFDEDGSYRMSRTSVFDNTERKRADAVLQKRDRELREKTKTLEEVNATLKVLLKNMETDQEELKERFLTNIKEQVLPYLDKLKKTPLNEVQKGFIKSTEVYLDEIASPFVQKLTSSYLNLTKKEVQIAVLVKEGKTSKEIAELVNVSKRDVDFHRGKIREKLGLRNKKGSLPVLLRTFSHEKHQKDD